MVENRSETTAKLVRDEVRRVAVEVFAERGVRSATLQDVADAVGMSRPALYRYFPSKDALVGDVIRNCAEQAAAIVSGVRDAGRPVATQLRDLVFRLVAFTVENPQQIRLLEATWTDLPAEARAVTAAHNRSFFQSVQEVLVEGVSLGIFRAVDVGIAAHNVAALTRAVAWWFDPSGPRTAEDIAAEIADTVLVGLTPAQPYAPAAARDALIGLRAELAALERALGDSGDVKGDGHDE